MAEAHVTHNRKPRIDLTNMRFGRLIVIDHVPHPNRTKTRWRCICDCGKETFTTSHRLRIGKTKSCGCLTLDVSRTQATKHGRSTTNLYRLWSGMIRRCTNPRNDSYAHYGAIGIAVCKRWRNFENFLADMGERPPGKSIDRIDNEKGYEPGNCRWATTKEQCNNKTNNQIITFNGRSLGVHQWATETGIHAETIKSRLRRGWSVDISLTAPVQHWKAKNHWRKDQKSILRVSY